MTSIGLNHPALKRLQQAHLSCKVLTLVLLLPLWTGWPDCCRARAQPQQPFCWVTPLVQRWADGCCPQQAAAAAGGWHGSMPSTEPAHAEQLAITLRPPHSALSVAMYLMMVMIIAFTRGLRSYS